MKEKIKNFVKYNKIIYKIYYYCMSIIIRFIGIFIKIDNNLILINSFGGKKYDDSPKVIYEYLIEHEEYNKYKIIWALDDINIKIPGRAQKMKNDTIQYFITALKAKYWITNSSLERGLNFKKKKTIELNTWHGTTIKKMASEVKNNKSFKGHMSCNIMLAMNEREKEFFSRGFNVPIENMRICGLPRNDELINKSIEQKQILRNNFIEKNNLDGKKKIILYAPTFREYININNLNTLKNPINFKKWKAEIGEEYIVLFRAHYETAQIMNFNPDNQFIYDFSKYGDLNELMIASDILISDYSSIINDYALLEKPIIDFAYDFEEYERERGVVDYIWKKIPNKIEKEVELINFIKNINYIKECEKTKEYSKKIGNRIENSTEKAVSFLFNYGKKREK